jgi:hypothetical protein
LAITCGSESKSEIVDDGGVFPASACGSLVNVTSRDAEVWRRKSRLERGLITAFL